MLGNHNFLMLFKNLPPNKT